MVIELASIKAQRQAHEPRYTLAEIAEAQGISKQAAQKRANKENLADPSLQAVVVPTHCPTLPKDVQLALQQRAMTNDAADDRPGRFHPDRHVRPRVFAHRQAEARA